MHGRQVGSGILIHTLQALVMILVRTMAGKITTLILAYFMTQEVTCFKCDTMFQIVVVGMVRQVKYVPTAGT